jgi:hypothetical protein
VSLTPVPTVAELLEHPERVQDLPPTVAAELLMRAVGLQMLLSTRVIAGLAGGHGPANGSAGDRLLTIPRRPSGSRCSGRSPTNSRGGANSRRFGSVPDTCAFPSLSCRPGGRRGVLTVPVV